jgi:hypothetical protein
MLKQNFQMLSGSLGGADVSTGRLRGNDITFTVGNAVYTGQVTGNSIKGTIKGGSGGTFVFVATR